MNVTFYLPRPAEQRTLDFLRTVGPDTHPGHFISGEVVWVLQTFLRLKDAGADVALSFGDPVPPGLVFAHYDRFPEMLGQLEDRARTRTICLRADRSQRPEGADYSVVQNESQVSARDLFLPHWPQPGLIPRDTARGQRIEAVDMKTHPAHTMPFLSSSAFNDFLADRRLRSIYKPSRFKGISPYLHTSSDAWINYADVDIVIGVRGYESYRSKPASKLMNAWLAGVPAILGPEVGYRALRENTYDYIEVGSDAGILAAIDHLINHPAEYSRYVNQGRVRAVRHDVAYRTSEWIAVIERLKTGVPAT